MLRRAWSTDGFFLLDCIQNTLDVLYRSVKVSCVDGHPANRLDTMQEGVDETEVIIACWNRENGAGSDQWAPV